MRKRSPARIGRRVARSAEPRANLRVCAPRRTNTTAPGAPAWVSRPSARSRLSTRAGAAGAATRAVAHTAPAARMVRWRLNIGRPYGRGRCLPSGVGTVLTPAQERSCRIGILRKEEGSALADAHEPGLVGEDYGLHAVAD